MRSRAERELAVEVENISKKYKIYPTSFSRIKEALYFGRKLFHSPIWALRDITLEVPRGTALGLIGANGAGKSTLLKILAGTTLPSSGRFEMHGKVSSLLELGTGFHPDFSGRQNIYLNGAVQGFSRREIDQKIGGIMEFAELGDFIDQPIRTYSSGMVMRLGFSMATAIDPEILIIDEILAVGDLHFQKKCVDRIFEFKNEGRSIIFCSHSLYDIRQVCDEVVWIKEGRMEEIGKPLDVTNNYANYERSLLTKEEAHTKGLEIIEGDDLPRIDSFIHIDGSGTLSPETVRTGDDLLLEFEFEIQKGGQGVNVGAAIFRTDNVLVATFSSLLDGEASYQRAGTYKMKLKLPDFRVSEGEYNLVAYLFDETGVHIYDHCQAERTLIVVQDVNRPGIVSLYHEWER
jgi:ABC-type polysaccharide/polyol phosphate transport system ATPase subunit